VRFFTESLLGTIFQGNLFHYSGFGEVEATSAPKYRVTCSDPHINGVKLDVRGTNVTRALLNKGVEPCKLSMPVCVNRKELSIIDVLGTLER
jgi:hypothetical protein